MLRWVSRYWWVEALPYLIAEWTMLTGIQEFLVAFQLRRIVVG